VVETFGLVKQGGGFTYTGVRGYHPLIASLAPAGRVSQPSQRFEVADRAPNPIRPQPRRAGPSEHKGESLTHASGLSGMSRWSGVVHEPVTSLSAVLPVIVL
jgi:hypothetical protein